MPLNDFNPWWKSGDVPSELIGKEREIFPQITAYMGYRQTILLYGLRRAGKTTIMHQLIERLLVREKTDPFEILYFSFDLKTMGLEEILQMYQVDILKREIRSGNTIYLFLDEIQKLVDWPDQVKIIYDRYLNVKIVLSGSAAIPLQKGAKESLAGRFFEFRVEPFSFDEFLNFKRISIDQTREVVHEREIKILFHEYLTMGGFIEAIDFKDMVLKKYLKESLLERVVYKDIPENFNISRPDLLFRLLLITAGFPGLYLDYRSIGNDLNVDQRTIANYISYLTYSLLVKKMYNFSRNRLTSEKKLKRVYLSNTGFMSALGPGDIGLDWLLESFFATFLPADFFYRSPRKEEVDIVLDDLNTTVPVEIKIREKIRLRDLKPLKKFINRFDCKEGIVISKDIDRVEKWEDKRITILPYWKYWSILHRIEDLHKP